MIAKITKIQGIGSFYNYTDKIDFYKLNLFYGDNGSGKSTFTKILKSLSENDVDLLLNKKTICENGMEITQDCELSLKNNSIYTHKFSNLSWHKYNSNYDLKNIIIFDDEFIERNIFTFAGSEINHARNQYKIIFGETGVKLNDEKETLVKNNKDILKPELETAKNNFELTYKIKIDDYKKYELTKTVEILNHEIEEVNKKINANKNSLASKLVNFTFLLKVPLILEEQTEELRMLLSANINSKVHLTAKKEVEEFKQKYFHQGVNHDNFLKYGIINVKTEGEKICPLCHNKFNEDLFDLYRDYFDKGYDEMIAKLDNIKAKFIKISNDYNNNLFSVNNSNVQIYNFWKDYVNELGEPRIDVSAMIEEYNIAIQSIHEIIDLKKEHTTQTDFKISSLGISLKINESVEIYNQILKDNNTKIENYKQTIKTLDLTQINKQKTELELELQITKQKESIKIDLEKINEKKDKVKKCEMQIKDLD